MVAVSGALSAIWRIITPLHSGGAWSRDGKRIFYHQTDGDIPESTEVKPPLFVPYSVALDGSDAQPVTGNSGDFLLPGVSPDGHWRVTDSQWDAAKLSYTPLLLHDLKNQTERASQPIIPSAVTATHSGAPIAKLSLSTWLTMSIRIAKRAKSAELR